MRRAFSDPSVPHESTGVEGRGTEEVKTNDVTGRVKVGDVGFTIEFGRPGVGSASARSRECAGPWRRPNVSFEKKNPITSLMSDVATGTLRPDILNEKVMSAIVEIKVPVARTEEIIRLVWEVEKRLDTVVALGVATRCGEHGEEVVVAPILERLGYKLERAKTNIGFGRSFSRQASLPGRLQAYDQHTSSLWRCRELLRRLHRLCHSQQDQQGSERAAQAPPLPGNCPGVQAREPGRRQARRRTARLKESWSLAHWTRDIKPDFQAVIEGLTVPTTCAAVFDNPTAAEQFVKRVKEENFGMSVNISTSIEGAERCCNYACIDRHSIGYSLGFEGKTEKIRTPRSHALDHVWTWHDQPLAGQENDRLCEGESPDPGAGCRPTCRVLLLRNLQSGARQEDSRRCPDEFEIVS